MLLSDQMRSDQEHALLLDRGGVLGYLRHGKHQSITMPIPAKIFVFKIQGAP